MGKYRRIIGMLTVVLTTLADTPSRAQNIDSLALQRLEFNNVPGADNVATLALILHQALQNTNFDPLNQHVINRNVYDRMFQTGILPVQRELILDSPYEMLQDLQLDFSQVIQDGFVMEISWPNTKITAIYTDTYTPHPAMVVPVTLELHSLDGLPFLLEFFAAYFEGRYYFMPPLYIVNEDLY